MLNYKDHLCIINSSGALLRIGNGVEEMKGQFVAIGGGFLADTNKNIYALDGNSVLFAHAPGTPTCITASPNKEYVALGMTNAGSRSTPQPNHTSKFTTGNTMLPR